VIALLSALALVSGALHIHAELRGRARQAYVFKPLTTVSIIAIAVLVPGQAPPAYRALVVAGLAFSLAGDVFLMLPSDRFLAGLGSFFVAHVLYIGAFSQAAGFQLSLPALLPFAVGSGLLLRLLWPQLGSLRAPVVLYVCIITAMGWQALAQWLALGTTFSLYALLGAALFTISDSALALDRFRGGFARAPLAVLGTYYPAQWLIALSVWH
jgi:uncharacterized membrane protein YhhN